VALAELDLAGVEERGRKLEESGRRSLGLRTADALVGNGARPYGVRVNAPARGVETRPDFIRRLFSETDLTLFRDFRQGADCLALGKFAVWGVKQQKIGAQRAVR